jgi:diguanylate cyclase (GGDEF)-like protein
MDYPLCERCGLDSDAIQERLGILGLDSADADNLGRALHDNVIAPNIDAIVDRFYSTLRRVEAFGLVVGAADADSGLKTRHENYLLGLGIHFREPAYFEERLRVGAVHQRSGVPQSLYQCTYQGLQSLLIESIPRDVRADDTAYEAMLRFILKIMALDMSLATESYCSARVGDLKQSLETERGQSERLRVLSITDWQTSLRNHSYARQSLEALLAQRDTEDRALCVIMADLDHFKAVNDRHGHLVGDEVLKICAARMVAGARADDEVCRYGGEEFLLILDGARLGDAWEVAERVRSRISEDEIHCGDEQIYVTISLGLAEAQASDTANSLIERADAALYAAKSAGRNCIRG